MNGAQKDYIGPNQIETSIFQIYIAKRDVVFNFKHEETFQETPISNPN